LKTILSILLLIFSAQHGGAQTIESATERAVRAADKAWAEAAASKDVDRMLSFYDKDATFIGETGALITGKEGLRKLWNRLFTMSGYELKWQAAKVEVSAGGDLAYSFGPWEVTVVRDGQPRKSKGAYLAVWKKQPDGNWKVLIDKP
jgi:uncharacterized protein (TIGR02246 family)